MTTYYVVCNVNGPISHRIESETIEDAIAVYESSDTRSWIDGADTDAEDDYDFDGADMTEGEFSSALEAAGCSMVRDLSVVENYHAGTQSHLADGWELWRAGE